MFNSGVQVIKSLQKTTFGKLFAGDVFIFIADELDFIYDVCIKIKDEEAINPVKHKTIYTSGDREIFRILYQYIPFIKMKTPDDFENSRTIEELENKVELLAAENKELADWLNKINEYGFGRQI